ncbi:SlyX family protein [Litchfieldella qijiaojingensis]|nr:SlyX family protein [Halomonas qijiaojingensis]
MTKDDSLAHCCARLDDLESRIAYQEHWLESLDRAVAAQEKRLAQLERLNELMQQRLREQQRTLQESDRDDTGFRPEDEIPPHY